MSERPVGGMQLTEANHVDDAFYCLGERVGLHLPRRDFEFRTAPSITPAPDSDFDWLLESIDADGDILEDKFISKETAEVLLGRTVEAARLDAIADLQKRIERMKARAQ